MFTPPPSPIHPPPKVDLLYMSPKESSSLGLDFLPEDDELEASPRSAASCAALDFSRKKAVGRRFRLVFLVVPLLFLVALSTHVASPIRSLSVLDYSIRDATRQHHGAVSFHKRSPNPQTQDMTDSEPNASTGQMTSSSSDSSSSATPTTTVPPTSQTIPPAPPASNPPTLPTPFPQPFDSVGATSNLSTSSCQAFFQNMTQADDFRKCRPLSLLLQYGSAFIQQAQTNLTSLSNIIFGTCNTVNSFDSCTQSLASYASQISTSCAKEIGQSNSMVLTTREGLLNYPIMRNVACLEDQAGSQGFCYVEAVHQSNPADLYLYQLPFGVPFPQAAKASCSPCGGSILSSYSSALQSGSSNGSTDGLKATYGAAASEAVSVCGSGYAQLGLKSGAESRWRGTYILPSTTAAVLSLAMTLL